MLRSVTLTLESCKSLLTIDAAAGARQEDYMTGAMFEQELRNIQSEAPETAGKYVRSLWTQL
jgi:hypothetical protein